MKTLRLFLIENAVPIIFIVLLAIGIPASGLPGKYIVQEILTRLGRSSFLVISLLLPIIAGMGLNFGMVLGAMAGQIGLVFIVDWGVIGIPGLLLAALISLPISILLGWMCGSVMNKAKGHEMVTGYILAFFMNSIYMLFVLYAMGTIIPVLNPALLLSRGYGVRSTVDLASVRQVLEAFIPLKVAGVDIPVLNYLIIAAISFFIVWFRKTKFGQDMRAAGQDREVASATGIAVNRARIIAIIVSTVLAGFGQIIYLQNLGTINTTNSHEQIGLFSIATLLFGGASVTKASIPNAILGVVLFHLLYLVTPLVNRNLVGAEVFGDYFRTFIIYGVILLTLVLYFWKRADQEEYPNVSLLGEYEASTYSYKGRFGLLQAIIAIYLFVLFIVAPVGSLSGALSKIFSGIGMSGVLVLALLPMIQSGCGLNFGLPIGVVAGLFGATISIEMGFTGVWGFIFAIILSQVFGAIFGYGYGALLNNVKGGEMIVSMFFSMITVTLASIAWRILPFTNHVMVYDGEGLRSTIALEGFWWQILDDFLAFEIAGFKFPTGLILFFLLISLAVWAFYRPKTGTVIANVNRTRIVSVVISTMLGAIGVIVYQQSFGFIQLYYGPLYMAFPAVAAILIGGAGVNKVSLANVFIGVALYQGILVMTPLIFNALLKSDMSDVIRIIVANGMILYALTHRTKVLI